MREQPWDYSWFFDLLPKPGTKPYTMLVIGKEPMTALTLQMGVAVGHRKAAHMLSEGVKYGWLVRNARGVYQTRDTVLAHLKIV